MFRKYSMVFAAAVFICSIKLASAIPTYNDGQTPSSKKLEIIGLLYFKDDLYHDANFKNVEITFTFEFTPSGSTQKEDYKQTFYMGDGQTDLQGNMAFKYETDKLKPSNQAGLYILKKVSAKAIDKTTDYLFTGELILASGPKEKKVKWPLTQNIQLTLGEKVKMEKQSAPKQPSKVGGSTE